MSSASKSAATTARATMSSAASSTSAKAMRSTRCSSSARRAGWKRLISSNSWRFRPRRAPSPTRSSWSSTLSRSRPANSRSARGYTTGGDTPGPSIEGSITERNFLGRGQFIRFSAGGGKNSRDFQLSFTEPYFLGRRIAAGFDIYRQSRTYDDYKSVIDRRHDSLRPADHRGPVDADRLQSLAGRIRVPGRLRCRTAMGSPTLPATSRRRLSTAWRDSPWIKSSVQRHDSLQHDRRHEEPAFGHLSPTSTIEFAGLGGDAEFVKLTARGPLLSYAVGGDTTSSGC